MFDVAVIGAGPAGSRVARRMAEKGFSTVVFDKKHRLDDPVCCTGIVGQELIDRYGIDRKVIYREANGAALFSPSGKCLRIQRDLPQAVVLNRPAFNRYLGELAQEAGAEYRLGCRVTGIERTGEYVEIRTDHPVMNRISSKTVVIADGFGSKIAEFAGLGKAGDFAMGVQVEVDAPNLEEVQVFSGSATAPGFFGWLVPTMPGKGLAGLITRQRTGAYLRSFLSRLKEDGALSKLPDDPAYCGVALKNIPKTSGDRVLAVGSAAGQVKPITGGGVYFGMISADIAADVLQTALEAEDLTEQGLSIYDKRWRKVLGREIRVGYWSRRFYERLTDRQIEKMFDIIISNSIDSTLLDSDDLRFDWHSAVILKMLRGKTLWPVMKGLINPLFSGK